MFNDGHTRFGAIIFNTFEASVLLLRLCTSSDFPGHVNDNLGHVLEIDDGQVTRQLLIQAAKRGLERLQMLAEASEMAASGAQTLAQLFSNISTNLDSSVTSLALDDSAWNTLLTGEASHLFEIDSDREYHLSTGYANTNLIVEPLPLSSMENSYSSSQISSLEFVNTLDFQ